MSCFYNFSGGTEVTITGSNLNIVQKPELGIILTRINKIAMSEKVSQTRIVVKRSDTSRK